MRPFTVVAALVVTTFIYSSCTPDRAEYQTVFKGLEVPQHFPPPHYNNPNNPITEAGFALGRKLFYDPILSRDSTISCGSCHAQTHAFADHNNAFSTGVDGRLGTRNSPTMSNLAWFPAFMWDGGINHIEIMPFAPITEHNEMDEDLANVINKLQRNSSYQVAFEKAFGPNQLNDQKMFFALAQFMSMMVSADAKYDQYMLGKAAFTEQERKGLELFRTHCESCHKEPLFTDFSYVNNGLDFTFNDPGRGRITQLAQDSGSFKVPTLRNIALTYPYMHDGRFFILADVMIHYTTGIKQNGRLDHRLPDNIVLTEDEKNAIMDFLHTLTDYTYISDFRLAEPSN